MTQPSSTTHPQPPGARSSRAVFWPLVLMALIFFASSNSQIAAPNVSGIDKFGHFVVYGWLGVLWARVPWVTRWKPLGVWTAVAVASLYGITDEFHQSFTPGRGVEFADWLADTVGALVAVTIYARWHGLRRWLEGGLFSRG
ncbi:VanZ family protein [Nibricoccus aquaticus]|uniref:VanZ family protein n=1 Tax=Nibricoccus aquaticus TaxID=2576891 RepID=UPI0015866807|nr:VanZ family protein [Nibricoccus aquaticus]